MTAPLRLYWWNGTPNFGDRLSQDVVAQLSGRPVVWAAPGECDLFAVGSLMNFVRRSHSLPRKDGTRPVIWGTGMIGPVRRDFVGNVAFVAVRGPLTAALLELKDLPMGDPGLLSPDLMPHPVEPDDRIGIVLHHSQKPDARLAAALKADPRLRLIDVTDEDHLGVIAAIGSCAHVFSSSLHGLIVADAFGVPNTWLNADGIHASAAFKFYDYALSVGRLLNRPLPAAAIAEAVAALPPKAPLSYRDGVIAAQQALRASFPAALGQVAA